MESSGWIPITQADEWEKVLRACATYDFYHTAVCHHIESSLGLGQPYLFSFEKDGQHAALPILLRPLPEPDETSYCDATSVYGYPGALTSLAKPDPEFAAAFQKAFCAALNSLKVVSFFSRLHPLLDNRWLLDGLGAVVTHGENVFIDLRMDEETYLAHCSRDHRKRLRRASECGFTLFLDSTWSKLDKFVAMYYETMRRNEAMPSYFFPENYFQSLAQRLGPMAKLFFLKQGEKLVSGMIVLVCKPYLTFHLSGTPTAYLSLGCVRPLYDKVRCWAKEEGFTWINLGGGVGNRHDSLFEFKAGFSNLQRSFCTARKILNQTLY